MVAPRLLLLTKHFPFGVKEPFLETEVPYLAKELRVAILPTAVADHEWSIRRPLPKSVEVYEATARRLSPNSMRWLQQLLTSPAILLRYLLLASSEVLQTPIRGWALRRLGYFTLHALLVFRELRQLPPVDVYYSYWLLSEALALSLFKEVKPSSFFISRVHGSDLYRHLPSGLYQPYQSQIIKTLDEIVCISGDGQQLLRRQYPVVADKIRVSRLGVERARMRNRSAATGPMHVVSCAFLSSVKRVDLLVDALAQCTCPICWTHLGGGELEALLRVKAEMLPANVRWTITGTLPNEAVHEFYQTKPVDLFVNTSVSEGLPVSVMEALSYGIPVAATMVGGTAELINERNGFPLAPHLTPNSLAKTLIRFLALPTATREAMREAAWRTWQAKANAQSQYTKFSTYLRNKGTE